MHIRRLVCNTPFHPEGGRRVCVCVCDFGAPEIDTPIEDQKWSGRFVERIRGSDRISSIGVVEITIPEEGASLRIHGFLKKSGDFT